MSDWDVIIAGGGIAGSMAAVAAARNGARTLLVERDACLGGTLSNGMVGPLMTFHSRAGQVIGGLAQEVVDRLVALGGSPGHIYDATGYVETITPYDGEVLKLVLQRMALEAGVTLLLHTTVQDVGMDGNRLTGLVVQHKGGRQDLTARVIIDASGDGDVAFLAGAPTEQGRSIDGRVQPVSLIFRMNGVELELVKSYIIQHPEAARLGPLGVRPYQEQPLIAVCAFEKELRTSISAGELALQREHVLFFSTHQPGEVTVNMSRVQNLNPLDAWDLTRAEVECREQIHAIAAFLQRRIPGFAHAHLTGSGSRIGIRESRRVMGEYILSAEDILNARHFDDAIARSAYPIDIHAPSPSEAHQDIFLPGNDATYEIPYRCLVPLKIEGLLTAGRCISTTHEAHASTRVSPTCMAFGQAAGTAAALALRNGVSLRKLDTGQLVATLRSQGALLRG